MSNIAASIITIGDELLIGQTIDTNSAWIAQKLNQQGIDLRRRVAVGDEWQPIINALDDELNDAQLVIITGGLGPTADDITKPLLLHYFGGAMRTDARVLEHVKGIFAKRNRPMLERNLKQAEVPDTCTVLFNRLGTAPGMWFERDSKIVISLPGVPFEMVAIMEDEVLPRLLDKFESDAIIHHTIVTVGEGESFIAEKIKLIEESLPTHIKLAYLPGAGMVKLRLTGKGPNEAALNESIIGYKNSIAEILKDIVIAMSDMPLESVLFEQFMLKGKSLGLAESCTGGYIAHHLTQVPGSSAYFKGGIVCYQTSIKENVLGVSPETIMVNGEVSEATAIELAKGAMEVLNVDCALSVTGLLGPEAAEDRVPVGTVWMAVASKDVVVSRKFVFHYDRIRNKEMAVSMGMLMIYKYISDLN